MITMKDAEIRERWYEFANRAFIEWRGPTRKTLSDFARYLNLPRSVVSQELIKNGKLPKEAKTIAAWVDKFGDEVYEVLDITPLEPNWEFPSLPTSLRAAFLEITETLEKRGLSPDSPEAEQIVIEIMMRHGYKHTSTTEE